METGPGSRHVALVFPKLPERVISKTARVEDDIRSVDAYFSHPIDTFGLELKIQFELERLSISQSRKSFHRIAVEPVITSYWPSLCQKDLKIETIENLTSMLIGRKAERRTGPIWADGLEGVRVVFEAARTIDRWMIDVSSIREAGYSPVEEAIILYAKTVFSHPFRDGNGRLARAMLYSSLARKNVIRTPCLGFGPIFDAARLTLAQATLLLSNTGDWQPYMELVLSLLQRSVLQVTRVIQSAYHCR